MSVDENKSSSKLIYNSNSIDYLATLNQETDRLNTNNNTNYILRQKSHQQLLNEHLKVITIIGSISVGIMIIIVITFIAKQYFSNKKRSNPETIEQKIPLNKSKKNTKMVSTTKI